MSAANVHAFPGVVIPYAPAHSLNLTQDEICEAAGGYRRPADQLRELQARGFSRAFRRGTDGKVVLERAHYEAVTRGQFGQPTATDITIRSPVAANLAGLRAFLNKKKAG